MSSLLPLKSSTEGLADRELDPLLVDFEESVADDILGVVTSSLSRRILTALYDEPQTPSDLAETVDTSVQNVGYHLPRLEEVGLVEVVDTWYSEKGREMNVYVPANGPLVLYAGAERARPSLTAALQRLFGAVGLVAVASVLLHVVSRPRTPTTDTFRRRSPPDLSTELSTVADQFLAGPGGLALAAGIGLVVGLFALWYWRLYRPTH